MVITTILRFILREVVSLLSGVPSHYVAELVSLFQKVQDVGTAGMLNEPSGTNGKFGSEVFSQTFPWFRASVSSENEMINIRIGIFSPTLPRYWSVGVGCS